MAKHLVLFTDYCNNVMIFTLRINNLYVAMKKKEDAMFSMTSKKAPRTVIQVRKLVFKKQHLKNFESFFFCTSIDSSRLPALQQKRICLTTGMEVKFALN
jgi:hypothetical protein